MPMLSLLHSAWQPGFKAGPTTRACNAAMAACARRGNLPAAQEIKQRMVSLQASVFVIQLKEEL